jgi:CBS domain-containing protein
MSTTLKVRDVMTADLVTVARHTSFKELAALLSSHRISAVPVLDDHGRLVGVVSQADLLPKEAYRDHHPTRREALLYLDEIEKAGGTTAGDVMTAPRAVIGPHATLGEAARLMARRQVRRLIVIDGREQPVGIISRSDLLKVFLIGDEQLAATVLAAVARALRGSDTSRLTVAVRDGIATVGGHLDDSGQSVAVARAARAVEEIVDVDVRLDRRRPIAPLPDYTAFY